MTQRSTLEGIEEPLDYPCPHSHTNQFKGTLWQSAAGAAGCMEADVKAITRGLLEVMAMPESERAVMERKDIALVRKTFPLGVVYGMNVRSLRVGYGQWTEVRLRHVCLRCET